MTDEAISQFGLALVFFTFSSLMALLQRMERSTTIRLWMISFLFFAADASISAARNIWRLPEFTRILSWCALVAGAMFGLLGAFRFLGQKIPYGLILLGLVTGFVLLVGAAMDIDSDYIRYIVFSTVGIGFGWIGILAFRVRDSGGAGRWVLNSAFFAGAIYSISWPVIRHVTIIARFEFFFDLILLIWSANGVLLMHFDRARLRMKAFTENEMALKEQLAHAERLEALGRLAAGVAHDFNNVLTTIINGTDLVLRQIEDRPDIVSRLKMVLKAAEESVGFTRQLLALGRQQLPGQKPTRLCEAIQRAMRIIRPSLSSDIQVNLLSIPDSLGVNAAEGQLEQILMNLILNAQDAMPNGGALTVSATQSRRGNQQMVQLLVTDTGEGMDEATKKHLFDPFFTTKEVGGTGLGLAAVNAIVEQLDGSISVESRLGCGSQFAITMPSCTILSKRTKEPRPIDPTSLKVFIVDDNESVTRSLTDGLAAVGFNAKGFLEPSEALVEALNNPPDILLTDVCMPLIQGPSLAQQIQSSHPNIHIILMTGISQDQRGTSELNDIRWLIKPVTINKVVETIQSFVSITSLDPSRT